MKLCTAAVEFDVLPSNGSAAPERDRSMSAITTHILDIATGRPASGVPVVLEVRRSDGTWRRVGSGHTDADGRLRTLTDDAAALAPGVFRLTFDTASYFARDGVQAL